METMAGFGLSESCPAVIGGGAGVSRCAWATETGPRLDTGSGARPEFRCRPGCCRRALGQLRLFRRVT